MKRKKILVTGGLGFIGSNLIEKLLKENFHVINIDKVSYSSNFYNTKDFAHNKFYKFVKCDINNYKKIQKLLNKYKPIAIFNLAAETHVDRSIENPKNFIKSNILGIFNLLENFKKYIIKNKKTKLIHISTDEVFGDVLKNRSKEEDKYKPSSPYAASKAASDHLVYSYFRTLNNKNLPIYGKGKNSREWIYVTDHCEALVKVLKHGKIGEFYNIGSNKNLNNVQICKYLIQIAKKQIKIGSKVKIKFVKDRPGHDLRYALNSTKIKKKLNWKPKTRIFDGLKKTFDWYLKNKNYYNSLKEKDITKRLGVIK